MQALAEFAPLVAFFVTYSLRGLYAATAVLMVAMLALLAFDWLRQRRIPPLHALSAALVLVLGGATLLLHNRLFIQWKPTVLFWLVSAAFIASFWIGERTLTQRFLEPALAGRMPVSPQQRSLGGVLLTARCAQSRGRLRRERAHLGVFQVVRPGAAHLRVRRAAGAVVEPGRTRAG